MGNPERFPALMSQRENRPSFRPVERCRAWCARCPCPARIAYPKARLGIFEADLRTGGTSPGWDQTQAATPALGGLRGCCSMGIAPAELEHSALCCRFAAIGF